MAEIIELAGNIWQVDLKDCGHPCRTAGYLVKGGDGWMLVETGPATSADNIFDAVKDLGIKSSEIKYIMVTHIHIDHAGGLGCIAQHFREAKIVVHYKGARHVIDPSRLIKGTTEAWGEEKMKEFGPILPVPEERVIPIYDGQTIDLGNRTIDILETPGHAKHHVCYYDKKTSGLFSGDAVGVYRQHLSKILNRPVMRPATPAPDFNFKLMLQSLLRLARLDLKTIYFTHFGSASPAQPLIELVIGQISFQLDLGKKMLKKNEPLENLTQAMLNQINKSYSTGSLKLNSKLLEEEWEFLAGFLKNSAGGILHYLQKEQKQ